jgi:hypothetical protein
MVYTTLSETPNGSTVHHIPYGAYFIHAPLSIDGRPTR